MTQNNNKLPEQGFVRINTILKFIPVGKSTWWQGVKDKRYPQPVKLSERVTAWRASDIQELINSYEV
jgi:predicted DNA-binding transcriptional regulator AlpA